MARNEAGRAIFVADGKIVGQAPPEQSFSKPRQEKTRNLMGRIPAS
ncbi:hypothetical protein [Pollutimonas sp. M17]|nr:hypothetical protein [Pollutimonas sp. M17]UYO93869.1 hypothetical protein OEG81_00640 [Pollutimonas sp. M17]